jgi:hypothetical protein
VVTATTHEQWMAGLRDLAACGLAVAVVIAAGVVVALLLSRRPTRIEK